MRVCMCVRECECVSESVKEYVLEERAIHGPTEGKRTANISLKSLRTKGERGTEQEENRWTEAWGKLKEWISFVAGLGITKGHKR